MKKNEQLTLGLGFLDYLSFDNFFSLNNEKVLAELYDLTTIKSNEFTYLWGDSGAGKTHLLQACCRRAIEHGWRAIYFSLQNFVDIAPQVFNGLEDLDLICVDDLHCLAGFSDWEEGFFHLFNRLHITQSNLLVAATYSPHHLQLGLPDLKSRLTSGIVFQLTGLTDVQKIEALQLHAHQRGFDLPTTVGNYLLTRYERDNKSLFALLDRLDRETLQAQQYLTVPFVKKILQNL